MPARKPKDTAPAAAPTASTPPAPPAARPAFPVVAIGASAGGLQAATELLRQLPDHTGMAFVLVQHLSPTHDSMLAEILGRATKMPVEQVAHEITVQADQVYVIPPGFNLEFAQGRLRLSPPEPRASSRPVDHFMRSLAQEQGHLAIGIILSGTGNDGTLGLQEIKAAGGITFAQDTTADHDGMPTSAVAAGAVDYVLPPSQIARELARIARHPYVAADATSGMPLADVDLERIVEALLVGTGVDFGEYKRNTLFRRITRRMVLHKSASAREYLRQLEAQPSELEALYQDVLINVTSFFRNPDAFESLKTTVFPRLTEERNRQEPLRVWVTGCSTGEEAYSIAMAFTEYMEATGRRLSLQVFATDVNATSIARARAGIYGKGIAQDVGPERLRRFFVEVDGAYRISKPIRDLCAFARHNVIADPVFSRMDLIACRNMLIYFEPTLQQKLIPTLHYSLRSTGFLWLGGSETIGSYRELFEPVDAKNKIYRKKQSARAALPLPATHTPWPRRAAIEPFAPREPAAPDSQREADRVVLSRYSPPAVLLNEELDIVQFRGDTSAFVRPAPGKASLNLLKMLREGLMVPIRGAISRARRDDTPVRVDGLKVRSGGGWRAVDAVAIPLKGGNVPPGAMLVLFEEPGHSVEARLRLLDAEERVARAEAPVNEHADKDLARLKNELAATRDYLQSVIEQQEAANEELQGANEEVQSANEELQSMNEELETSKEEIQSSNEELATVNDELHARNIQLAQSNSDLVNLVSSVHMAIVMLGPDLRIRRFTATAEKLLGLVPADAGRPIGEVKLKLDVVDLEDLLQEVIQTVSTREREIEDRNHRWYSMRVRPYLTLDNKIDGAVMVLVDVTTLKEAEQVLVDLDRGRNEFLAVLAHELRNPLSGMRNASHLLAASADKAIHAHAREIIERQTTNMVRMVDDLLDISRVTHGKIELRSEPVDVGTSLRRAIQATATEREAAGQTLVESIPKGPLWIRGDPMRLEQVFTNLLGNACKFTRDGGRVWVSAERDARGEPEAARIVVRIRDNGRGMDAALLPRIFDLFLQGDRDPGPGRARGGIGLGLALARRLVDLHGGTIEAASGGNALGSEFTIRLPAMDEAQAPRRPAQAPASRSRRAQPRRILIVDDNADSAESLRLILALAGHEVRVVNDGGSTAAAVGEFDPQVVLLDIGLPDRDGYTVARELRSSPKGKQLLLVAVSGYGREEDLRKGREAGIDAHFTKPIDPDALGALIAQGRA